MELLKSAPRINPAPTPATCTGEHEAAEEHPA